MLRILLIFIFSLSLYGYKDSNYFGVFQSSLGGETPMYLSKFDDNQPGTKFDTDIEGEHTGLRLGFQSNIDKEHLTKERVEFTYEPREYTFKKDGSEYSSEIQRYSISYYYGRNLDLLLNDELIFYIKAGFGYSRGKEINEATDETFGLSLLYATKNFDIQIGYDVELVTWGALVLVPYDYIDSEKRDGEIHNLHGGINIRF